MTAKGLCVNKADVSALCLSGLCVPQLRIGTPFRVERGWYPVACVCWARLAGRCSAVTPGRGQLGMALRSRAARRLW